MHTFDSRIFVNTKYICRRAVDDSTRESINVDSHVVAIYFTIVATNFGTLQNNLNKLLV